MKCRSEPTKKSLEFEIYTGLSSRTKGHQSTVDSGVGSERTESFTHGELTRSVLDSTTVEEKESRSHRLGSGSEQLEWTDHI